MDNSFWNTLRLYYAWNKFLSRHLITLINFAVMENVCLRCHNFQNLFKSLNILKSSLLYWICLWRFDAAKTIYFIKSIFQCVGINFPCLFYSSLTYSPCWCLSFPGTVGLWFRRCRSQAWLLSSPRFVLGNKDILGFWLIHCLSTKQCIECVGGDSQWYRCWYGEQQAECWNSVQMCIIPYGYLSRESPLQGYCSLKWAKC